MNNGITKYKMKNKYLGLENQELWIMNKELWVINNQQELIGITWKTDNEWFKNTQKTVNNRGPVV